MAQKAHLLFQAALHIPTLFQCMEEKLSGFLVFIWQNDNSASFELSNDMLLKQLEQVSFTLGYKK